MKTVVKTCTVAFGLIGVISCGAGAPDDSPSVRPPEYDLATIEKGHWVPDDDLAIARFRDLLDQLSETCVESRIEIADMTVSMQRHLRDSGIAQEMLPMMEGINRVCPLPSRELEHPNQYSEYVAAYTTLRKMSYGHEEALAGLHDSIDRLHLISR